jgi:hypothetical protein
MPLFEPVLEALDRRGVRFVVVGGVASSCTDMRG